MRVMRGGSGRTASATMGARRRSGMELKDTYSAIEEAKADMSGLWALKQLADQGRSTRRSRKRSPDLSWPRRSDRSASASTRRMAAASPFSSTTSSIRARSWCRRRAIHGRRSQDDCGGDLADARHHDAQAEGSYPGRQSPHRDARRHASVGAAGARAPDVRASGHRTEVHDRCDAGRGRPGVRPRSDPGPLPHNRHSDVGTIAMTLSALGRAGASCRRDRLPSESIWQAGPVRRAR